MISAKEATLVVILHYEELAGKASLWLYPGVATHDTEYAELENNGTLILGRTGYDNIIAIENGLKSFFPQLGINLNKQVWGEE